MRTAEGSSDAVLALDDATPCCCGCCCPGLAVDVVTGPEEEAEEEEAEAEELNSSRRRFSAAMTFPFVRSMARKHAASSCVMPNCNSSRTADAYGGAPATPAPDPESLPELALALAVRCCH